MKTLKELRESSNFTQLELAKKINTSQQTIANWEAGRREPSKDMLMLLSEVFNVSIDYILGNSTLRGEKKGVKIPVLGRVQAGIPISAVEEILGYEEISEELASTGEFFALQVKGDSMEPKFSQGDVVIVKQQNTIENNQIAIVMIDKLDTTMKKIKKTETGIMLMPLNPIHEPKFYTYKDVESRPVEIIGKVVELRAKF